MQLVILWSTDIIGAAWPHCSIISSSVSATIPPEEKLLCDVLVFPLNVAISVFVYMHDLKHHSLAVSSIHTNVNKVHCIILCAINAPWRACAPSSYYAYWWNECTVQKLPLKGLSWFMLRSKNREKISMHSTTHIVKLNSDGLMYSANSQKWLLD